MLMHEKRFLAAVIDIAVVLVISFLIFLFIPTVNYAKSAIFMGIYAVSALLYFFVLFVFTKGYTLGLKVMGLKIMNNDWSAMNVKTAFLRSLCYITPAFYLLNLIYIFINKTTITLFDVLTDTFVAKMGDTYKISKY